LGALSFNSQVGGDIDDRLLSNTCVSSGKYDVGAGIGTLRLGTVGGGTRRTLGAVGASGKGVSGNAETYGGGTG
tara:strand:- start:199 stop:420 length:222 start_codon:yes stop_codon:yes gene_type:complete